MRAPRDRAVRAAALAAGVWLLACGAGVPQQLEAPPLTDEHRTLYARINLEKARALQAEGRFEMAASAARRGLAFEPDNAELHRIRANALEAVGDAERAREHWQRANELDPPPPPPAELPHALALVGGDVRIALLPPAAALLASPSARERVPRDWPRGEVAETLVRRLRIRLPRATLSVLTDDEQRVPATVPAARAWLATPSAPDALVSLRVERAFCGSSIKDGEFAVAWLRVAVARPGAVEPATHLVRVSVDGPTGDGCRRAAVAAAVERVLELSSVRAALESPADAGPGAWSGRSLRLVFPRLEEALQAELDRGRRYLSLGELALAREHFAGARRVDPEDPVAASFLRDTDRSLELAAQLSRSEAGGEDGDDPDPAAPAGQLAPQLSPAQRSGLEAQLAHERRRREEMLSTLAVLYELRNAPTPGTLASLRPGEPSATGVALARRRAAGDEAVEVRTLYAPDGGVLTRYYFAGDAHAPVLREDDTNGDGAPDRWIGYEAGVLSEIWESERPGGPPTVHLVYAPGGSPIERVELDQDGDGRLERLFVYRDGRLREESWDTDGDGAYDRWQHFDETGSLTVREEDVNGDERIDVRTAYHRGRIVRREILDAEVMQREIQ